MYHTLKYLPSALSYPLIITSVAVFITTAAAYAFDNINYTCFISLVWNVACAASMGAFSFKSKRKALAVPFLSAFSYLTYYYFSAKHIGLLISVIIAVVSVRLLKKLSFSKAFFLLLFVYFSVFLLAGYYNERLLLLTEALASALKGKPSVFGAVQILYNIFFDGDLAKLFYHGDYSQAVLSDSGIITGAVDIFRDNVNEPGIIVSKYLTGNYFVNIFVSLGVPVFFFPRVDNRGRITLIFTFAASCVCGDFRLIMLFAALYNPVMLLGLLFPALLSFFVASLLDLRLGFVMLPSLFELVRYGNEWGVLLLTGGVLSILTVFVLKIINARFPVQDAFLPPKLNSLLSALGGRENILRINDGYLTVKNPNLIDIIRLDCDIHGMRVSLYEDDFELIKEYYKNGR